MTLMTLAELEALTTRHIPPPPPPMTARDGRHQILGAIKIIARMSGMSMVTDVAPVELLVRRIDELEAEAQRREAEIQQYREALAAVGIALEAHSDPFEAKVASKWAKSDLVNWIQGVCQSITWVMTRAENALDPEHAQPVSREIAR